MRDQAALAMECVEVETAGGNVIDFLKAKGFISARATWERLQINELGRGRRNSKGVFEVAKALLTEGQKARAIEIAMEGGNPIPYLKQCGSTNPTALFYTIKKDLQKKDPGKYAELLDRYDPYDSTRKPKKKKEEQKMEEVVAYDDQAAEVVPKVTEAPDAEKKPEICVPLMYGGLTAIGWEGKSGRFYRNGNYLTYNDGSNELYMTIEWWKAFAEDFALATKLLGVDLGVSLHD